MGLNEFKSKESFLISFLTFLSAILFTFDNTFSGTKFHEFIFTESYLWTRGCTVRPARRTVVPWRSCRRPRGALSGSGSASPRLVGYIAADTSLSLLHCDGTDRTDRPGFSPKINEQFSFPIFENQLVRKQSFLKLSYFELHWSHRGISVKGKRKSFTVRVKMEAGRRTELLINVCIWVCSAYSSRRGGQRRSKDCRRLY